MFLLKTFFILSFIFLCAESADKTKIKNRKVNPLPSNLQTRNVDQNDLKLWEQKRSWEEETEADFNAAIRTMFANADPHDQDLTARQTFLKKLFLLMIINPPKVAYQEPQKPSVKKATIQALPDRTYQYDRKIPLATYLMHGRRILVYILNGKDFAGQLLGKGELAKTYDKRIAASHGTTYKNGYVDEVKLGGLIGSAKNLAYGVMGQHKFVNIPLGGYMHWAKTTVPLPGKEAKKTNMSQIVEYQIGRDGSAILSKEQFLHNVCGAQAKNKKSSQHTSYNCHQEFEKIWPAVQAHLKKIQHGHVYVFTRDFGKQLVNDRVKEKYFPNAQSQKAQKLETSSLLIGIEGSMPGRKNMFGHTHDAKSADKDSTLEPSILNGKKFERLTDYSYDDGPDKIPLGYGGTVIFLDKKEIQKWQQQWNKINKIGFNQETYFEENLKKTAAALASK